MNRADRICALCSHYTTQHAIAKPSEGIGACVGFQDAGQPANWNDPFCVLFRRSPDRDGARVRYVQEQVEKKTEEK